MYFIILTILLIWTMAISAESNSCRRWWCLAGMTIITNWTFRFVPISFFALHKVLNVSFRIWSFYTITIKMTHNTGWICSLHIMTWGTSFNISFSKKRVITSTCAYSESSKIRTKMRSRDYSTKRKIGGFGLMTINTKRFILVTALAFCWNVLC